MDKSAANKKKSPAGTTRRAYSIFGGIINLTQQQQQQSHITKSNVLASSPGNVGGGGGAGAAVGSSGKCSSVVGGGTSQDPQGSSSNVYTVTVTNSQTPDNTNQVKTYENLVPMVVVRKVNEWMDLLVSTTYLVNFECYLWGIDKGNGERQERRLWFYLAFSWEICYVI